MMQIYEKKDMDKQQQMLDLSVSMHTHTLTGGGARQISVEGWSAVKLPIS
jgi:hypothetical protein